MRNSIKISRLFSCLSLFLLFTGCEGFFTNNDVDDKIRAAIDYANTPFSTFVVSADSNAGTIIPSGQVQYKPTDTQIITFTLKPQYQFIKWNFSYKEISKGTDAPTLTAADSNWWKDYITIKKETVSEPNAKGEIEYVLEINFTKATENLLIEPVCSLKPEIKTFTPAYKLEGVSRLTQVSIEFNGPIDQDSIFFSQTEITAISGVTDVLKNDQNQIYGYEKDGKRYFKNIQILLGSTEIDVNDCFGDFSYRSDINTLFITPKRGVEIVGDVAEVKIVLMNGIKNISGATLTETTKVYCVNKSSNQQVYIDIKYNTNSHASINSFAGIDQEITFPADETVQFLYWKVTANSQESVNKITVYNNSDKTPLMKFCANTVILPSEGVTITAVYKKRPSIVTNGFTPMDQNDGVDKDSDIKIVFDQAVNLDSFIAGYKIDCNGTNVKVNFDTPVLDTNDTTNKTIIIPASSDSTIDIDSGTKKITVTIPASLYYSYTDESDGTVYQITAGEDIVRTYKINPDTKDKLYINFVLSNNEMGSFNNPGRAYYNRGEKFSILFSEPAYGQSSFQKYQFIGWTIPSSAASKIECVQSPSNSMLYEFTVKGRCDASSPITITADVRERINIVSFTPADSTNGVPKDSDIEITFNKPLSLTNCKDLISISCNGQDVSDSFPKSNWKMTGNTLTIPADKSNRLTLNSTPKGRVQVTIDSNLTYTDTDGKIITFKESDRSKSYCINNSTIDFAILTFSENSNEGSITYESKDKYSIGEELSLTFTPDDDYEFLYWQISNANVGSFTQQKEITTKLKIDAEGNATISAKCAPKLKINSFKIKKGTDDTLTTPADGTAYPKDSDIVIEFNKSPSSNNNLASSISITIDGASVADNFKTASLSGSTVTYEANQEKRIQVNDEKTINVKVKNDLFYEYTDSVITTPKRIYMKEAQTKTYTINQTTRRKAKVQVTQDDSSSGLIKDTAGNNFTSGLVEYNKDQTFKINYELSEGYEFISWIVTGTTDNVSLSSLTETSIEVTINNSNDGNTIIKPYCEEKLQISNIYVNGYAYGSTGVYPKDSKIIIDFNKNIGKLADYSKYIHLKYNSNDIKDTYYTLEHEEDTNRFIFKPKDQMFLPVYNTDRLELVIEKEFYYPVSANTNLTLDRDYIKSININYKTTKYFTIETVFESETGTVLYSPSYSDGKYYLGQEISILFVDDEDYSFDSWEAESSKTSGIDDLTIQRIADSNNRNFRFICTSANSTGKKLTLTATSHKAPKLMSISPAPALYDKDNKQFLYSESIPCDTIFKFKFNEDIRWNTANVQTITPDAYNKSTKPRQGFRAYTIINGTTIELGGTQYKSQTADSDKVDTDIIELRAVSNILQLFSANNISELRLYIQVFPRKDNGYEHLRTKSVMVNGQETGDKNIVGYYKDLDKYISEDDEDNISYTISYVLNNTISATRPIVIEEEFYLYNSVWERQKNSVKYLTSEQKIKGSDAIFDCPEVANTTGKLEYKFKVINSGNWIRYSWMHEANMDIELRRVGRCIKPAGYDDYEWDYDYQNAHLNNPELPLKFMTTYSSDPGEIDLSQYFSPCDVINVVFTIYDINYGFIKRNFYVYYDPGIPLSYYHY